MKSMECDPRRHKVNLRSVSGTKPTPSPDPEYGYYIHRGLQVAGESGRNVVCVLLEEGEWKDKSGGGKTQRWQLGDWRLL